MSKLSSAGTGATIGAAGGSAFGPVGTVVGAAGGGILGYILGSDEGPKISNGAVDPATGKIGGKYGGISTEELKSGRAQLEAKIAELENTPLSTVGMSNEDRAAILTGAKDHPEIAALKGKLAELDGELTSFERVEGDRLKQAGAEESGKLDQFGTGTLERANHELLGAQARGNDQLDAAQGFFGQANDVQNRQTPQLDLSRSLENAGKQDSAINRLQAFVNKGPGPSVAEAQLKYGSDRAINAAGSLAASGRGYGVSAAARRDALNAQASQLGQLNMQQGIVRAQETNDWNKAQIEGQTNVATARSDARGRTLNEQTGAADTALKGVTANDAATGTYLNAGGNATNSGNAAYGQGYDIYGNLSSQAGEAYSQAGQIRRGYDSDANGLRTGQAGLNVDLATGNAARQQGADIAKAEAKAKEDGAGMGMIGGVLGNIVSDVRAKQNIREADVSSELSALRSLVAKEAPATEYPSLRQPGEQVPTRAYDLLPAQPKSWQYTPEAQAAYGQDGRTNVGPMAQDLEKTPLRSAVSTGPDGRKVVDTGKLTMGLTGAVAEQQSDQDDLRQELERLRALVDRRADNWRSQPTAVSRAR